MFDSFVVKRLSARRRRFCVMWSRVGTFGALRPQCQIGEAGQGRAVDCASANLTLRSSGQTVNAVSELPARTPFGAL